MKIVRFDSIDSTNEEARRMIEAGEPGPCWIVAHEQTRGRGRRGRTWVSQPGNLFTTLLISPPGSLEQRAQLSFVAGLAAAMAIEHFLPEMCSARLKWPNDILLGGRKVAGMLLESVGPAALAVGFGINIVAFPEATEFPATSIKDFLGAVPPYDKVLACLAARWDTWYATWESGGFAPVRDAWMRRAEGIGAPIRVRLMDREMNGIFENVDDDGALLLRQAGGALARVTAGDVFFGS